MSDPVQEALPSVICHRMHTPTGAWGWITGPANAQEQQDTKTFGWRIENAYSEAAIEQLRAEVARLGEELDVANTALGQAATDCVEQSFRAEEAEAEAAQLRAEKEAAGWQPIETAPVSTPMDQQWFLAYCPDDDWAPLGRIHIACAYQHAKPGMVKVHGSNNDRRATHWTTLKGPAAMHQEQTP